jgi:hypothetical protein
MTGEYPAGASRFKVTPIFFYRSHSFARPGQKMGKKGWAKTGGKNPRLAPVGPAVPAYLAIRGAARPMPPGRALLISAICSKVIVVRFARLV